jgi:hypothetical protein
MNLNCEVALIGIQPASTTFDSTLSIPMDKAVNEIISTIKTAVRMNLPQPPIIPNQTNAK